MGAEGRLVGRRMGLHLSKAVKPAIAAEDDRSTCDAILVEGYRFRDGFCTLSSAPGLGMRVGERVYKQKYRAAEVVV